MTPSQIIEWSTAVFIGAVEFIILWRIWTNRIDLTYLVAEDDGQASLSRFQMLFFTFVIGSILAVISLCGDKPDFPKAFPVEILGLLGISGGSYVLSKGIQFGNPQPGTGQTPASPPPGGGQAS